MHGSFQPNATTARLQAIKRRTIRARYRAAARDQRRTNPATRMAWLRLAEMERLFAHRYGCTLPDDDAGRDDLELALHHIAGAGIDVAHRCVSWARLWAPWMSKDAAKALAEQVIASLLHFRAAPLGRRLRLTKAERAVLKIRTIRAIDATEAPAQRKRRLDRDRKAKQRAEARAARPEPISRTKPWEAEGISRRTWYRRKRHPPSLWHKTWHKTRRE